MEDFFLRALAGGIGVALASGPVGCFVVWRRMSFFGAALSHTVLLGAALGILMSVEPTVTILCTCVVFAGIMASMERTQLVSLDSLLGVLAHVAFALGLVVISFMERMRVDLLGYLLGDILSVGPVDLWIIYGTAAVAGILVAWQWRSLLAVTVDKDLAAVEGVKVERIRLLLVFLVASVVAIGMKIVGMVLVVALVIIPAAAARRFVSTPVQMVVAATAIGVASSVIGLYASLTWDLPAGAAIVLAAGAFFAAGQVLPARSN